MAYLKYYENEQKVFPEAMKRKLERYEAKIVFRKLTKHYKVYPILRFMTRGNNANQYRVHLTLPTNFLVMCHELAHSKHFVERQKMLLREQQMGKRYRHHGKRHFRIMKSMIHYCERKNWFEQELIRRSREKTLFNFLDKPIHTKQN